MKLLQRHLAHGTRGQLLAVAFLLPVLGLASAAVAVALTNWYRARAAYLVGQQQLLEHERRLAISLALLRRQVTEADAGPSMAEALLGGDSDAIAGAALQAAIQDMATAADAALTSTEILVGEQLGNFRLIRLRITLNTTWPALVALLRAVDESPKRLLVDDLQLHTVAQLHLTGSQQLDASFVVLGFRSGREAAPPHGAGL